VWGGARDAGGGFWDGGGGITHPEFVS